MSPVAVDLPRAAAFLESRYGERVRHVSPLGGGDWSRAFSFRLDGRELVARFGPYREDFEMDALATAFAGPDLPDPRVLEVGEALGGAYAVSERHDGVFLEDLDEDAFRRLLPALLRMLDALRHLPVPPDAAVEWGPGGRPSAGWREWLTGSLVDRPGGRVSGGRSRLAGSPRLDALFAAGEDALGDLVGACPEIRHVVHADLLNRNVLVREVGTSLGAVFDWGCSVHGDFLYDVAWFTFWAPWHRGLAAVDLPAALRDHLAAGGVPVPSFDERLRCYELHIGLHHLAYAAFAGREADLEAIAARTRQVLDASGG